MKESSILPYAPAVLALLKGVVSEEDSRDLWTNLIEYEEKLKQYFASIGIELLVYNSDGFAFLRQKGSEDDTKKLPQLIEKRSLSYSLTLLLVLLREKLLEMDNNLEANSRLILSKAQIKEMLFPFLKEGTNEAKFMDKIDSDINKLLEYGFVRKLKDDPERLEVKRIVKAKIPAEELNEIKNRLGEYGRTTGLFD
jgi:hypothetical protein